MSKAGVKSVVEKYFEIIENKFGNTYEASLFLPTQFRSEWDVLEKSSLI